MEYGVETRLNGRVANGIPASLSEQGSKRGIYPVLLGLVLMEKEHMHALTILCRMCQLSAE